MSLRVAERDMVREALLDDVPMTGCLRVHQGVAVECTTRAPPAITSGSTYPATPAGVSAEVPEVPLRVIDLQGSGPRTGCPEINVYLAVTVYGGADKRGRTVGRA